MNTQPPKNNSVLYGIISLAAGIGLMYYFIWRNLDAMARKEDNISYSLKGVGIGPFLVVFGLYLLILRPPSLKPNEMSSRERTLYWVMVGVSVIAGILIFMWFKGQAAQLGYEI